MEEAEDDGRGNAGERGEGLSGLRQTFQDGYLVQIPGAGLEGGGRRLAGGGEEPLEGAEELDKAGEDSGMGGLQPTGLWDVIQGGGAGGDFIRAGGVGTDPPHGTGTGKLLAQDR